MSVEQTIADNELHKPSTWRRDLIAAGWTEERHTQWRDLEGRLWRGPFGAWQELKRRKVKGKTHEQD